MSGTGSHRATIVFDHLEQLSDEIGLFEHAHYRTPRREHGYCVDDVARGIIVVAREPSPPARVEPLLGVYLSFVMSAVSPSGRVHNRRDEHGTWTDAPDTQDWWGRAAWGLGTAIGRLSPTLLDRCLQHRVNAEHPGRADVADGTQSVWSAYERCLTQRSRSPRAMAFAALGAAEVLASHPEHEPSRSLLMEAARAVDEATVAMMRRTDGDWPWPEERLAYANAVLPETLLAAGEAAGDEQLIARGLDQLRWLADLETSADGHLSVVPTYGWATGEPRPAFDQQPLEVAALADAAARAGRITGDPSWDELVLNAEAWFFGKNDKGVSLIDPPTGAGYDGLMPHGRNENCGAESTLALLTTLQQAQRIRERS